jgi:proline iminopeptidase
MTAPAKPPEPSRPFDAIMLDVGDGHWIYVEEVGRRDGIPAIFLHGGPGSGSQHGHRSLFDPTRYHAILFDQRGAGRSHPYLGTDANTTAHLVRDIEAIRERFGIEKWLVVGGSWGSTLALAYAEAHPGRVAGLVLRAVFLGTRHEVDWAFIEGPRTFCPELYEAFVRALPPGEQNDPLAAYLERLSEPDPAIHGPAARIWFAYERALSELKPAPVTLPANLADTGGRVPPTPLVEAHYIRHDFFLEQDELLTNAHRLAGIPGVIIQGRYDLLCPPRAAHAIASAWSDARLAIMDNAGHAMSEPGVLNAMRDGLNALAGRYGPATRWRS